jgi:SRSO17 transposase
MEAEVPEGWQAWVVARRSLSDPTEVVYYRVCAPKQTTLQQIVEVAGQRWRVEEAIERAKGECGLDQYEVRSWTGWYRHITLSLLAQCCATLMMEQANVEQGKKAWEPQPSPSSLQPFKSRRGLAVG